MKKILIIVDPQNDFITGSLAVPGAEEKMKALANYLYDNEKAFDSIYITMDSHPKNHCSFKDNGGIWPEHCVLLTKGWDIPAYLMESLYEYHTEFYKKGTESNKEEYSIFDNEEDGNYLKIDLIEEINDSTEVYICGIAGDYCVLETLKGLDKFADNIIVLNDYTASIDGGEKLKNYILEHSNIELI
jgi:nicotinamidase/pyrazinamidase